MTDSLCRNSTKDMEVFGVEALKGKCGSLGVRNDLLTGTFKDFSLLYGVPCINITNGAALVGLTIFRDGI